MNITIDKLFTSRLLLRKADIKDLKLLVKWSHSSEYCGEYLSPEEFEATHLMQQFESGVYWSNQERMFMIEHKTSGSAIGTIHFWQPAGKTDTRVVALKIADKNERGKGYGTEAQKFLLIYLFDRMNVKKVEMYTDINNVAQHRCLMKLGFELVESLSYDDHKTLRTGNLYCLENEKYQKEPIYRYHYE